MKKGISLIVLVITIIVLAILAAAVIISLSPNNNVMEKGTDAVEAANLASARAVLSMYVANNMSDDFKRVVDSDNVTMTNEKYELVLIANGLNAIDFEIIVNEDGFIISVKLAADSTGDSGESGGSAGDPTVPEGSSIVADAKAAISASNIFEEIYYEELDGVYYWEAVTVMDDGVKRIATKADYEAVLTANGLNVSDVEMVVGSNGIVGGIWLAGDNAGKLVAARTWIDDVTNVVVASACPDDHGVGDAWYSEIMACHWQNVVPGNTYVINSNWDNLIAKESDYRNHLTYGGFNANDFVLTVNENGTLLTFSLV